MSDTVSTVCGDALANGVVVWTDNKPENNEFYKIIGALDKNQNGKIDQEEHDYIQSKFLHDLSPTHKKNLSKYARVGLPANHYMNNLLLSLGYIDQIYKGRAASADPSVIAAYCERNGIALTNFKGFTSGRSYKFSSLSEAEFGKHFTCLPCAEETPAEDNTTNVNVEEEEDTTPVEEEDNTAEVTVEEEQDCDNTTPVTVEEEKEKEEKDCKTCPTPQVSVNVPEQKPPVVNVTTPQPKVIIEKKGGSNLLGWLGLGLGGAALLTALLKGGGNKKTSYYNGGFNVGGYCPPQYNNGYNCWTGGGIGGGMVGGICPPYDGWNLGGGAYASNGRYVQSTYSPTYGYIGPQNYMGAQVNGISKTGNTYLLDTYMTPNGPVGFQGIRGVGTWTSPTTLRA